MIEETALVVSQEGSHIWVETQRKSTCGACSAKTGCGTSALEKVVGQRAVRLRVLNTVDAEVGEQVIIGLDDAALVRGSLVVYLIPLLLMIAGALVGEFVAGQGAGDLPSALGGLVGLVVGFGWLKTFSAGFASKHAFQPQIIRRLGFGDFKTIPLVKTISS